MRESHYCTLLSSPKQQRRNPPQHRLQVFRPGRADEGHGAARTNLQRGQSCVGRVAMVRQHTPGQLDTEHGIRAILDCIHASSLVPTLARRYADLLWTGIMGSSCLLACLLLDTTSGQLKIDNPPGGVRTHAKTANSGLVDALRRQMG